MPRTKVIYYQEKDGTSPLVEWLRELRNKNLKAWANCRARIEQLEESGHELRRPAVDYLENGIYELRAKQGNVQYRLLYFFHGRQVAILAHGLTKEDTVPPADIERALRRKKLFESDPEGHTYEQQPES
jgi:phage-related protein